MDKFPLLWEGRPLGELTAEREGGSFWFEARCRPPAGKGLWCAWIVGDRGELRLGALEPTGGGEILRLRRQFSDRMTQPVGRILRGELRPAGGGPSAEDRWERADTPEQLLRTPWLRQRLRAAHGVLFQREGNCVRLALLYDKENTFPLVPLFCLARLQTIRGAPYVVFCFDEREQPIL